MWEKLLDKALRGLIHDGALTVTWPGGNQTKYGDGNGLSAAITLHSKAGLRKLFFSPELALGEAYMDETLTVAQDDVMGLLTLIARNSRDHGQGRFLAQAIAGGKFLRRLAQHSPLATSRKNVEHHYDLSTEFYELMLCEDMQYTCAYFPRPGMSVAEAQVEKKAHIAKKLLIKPGMKVLDIGCGWGGMSITLAKDYGAQVTGVSLSAVQIAYAKKRAEAAGVADKVDFRLIDYRDVKEKFDRIVVVGMIEHVGQPQYATFFNKLAENLTKDGVALLHTIGRKSPPGKTSHWLRKYIFPGGYCPAMSEVLSEVEQTGLYVTDIEVWRGQYAETLRQWRLKFEQNIDQIRDIYDERFIRMWRYYLVISEVAKNEMGMVLFHFQMSKQQMTVPVSRAYLYDDA